MTLLSGVLELWDDARAAFGQTRVWRRARRLALSQLACLERHTITGLLCTGGRQFVDWSADYRFFARDVWDPNHLFRPVLRAGLALAAEGPLRRTAEGDDSLRMPVRCASSLPTPSRRRRLVVAVDDTLLRKSGKKTPGVAYRRDPLSPAFQVNLVLAQRFVPFSLLLPSGPAPPQAEPVSAPLSALEPVSALAPGSAYELAPAIAPGRTAPAVPTAARGVPCRFEHVPALKKPKAGAGDEAWTRYRETVKQQNLNAAAVRMTGQLRDELDQVHQAADCELVLVVDGSYTNQTVLPALPERTTLIGRIRKDAKLYFPDEFRSRRYGPTAPTPEQLRQDEQTPWQAIAAYAAGRTHTFRVKTLGPIRWRKTGTQLALRLVVIAPVGYRLTQKGRLLYRQPAYLICTDPDLDLPTLVQEYLWRWDIEVNHRDEKQIIGVGQAQVRAPQAVNRQPTFAVACYATLLLAAMNVLDPQQLDQLIPLPKWQPRGARGRLSTQRLIQWLRQEVWGQAFQEITSDNSAIAARDDETDFLNAPPADTKSPEPLLAALPPIAYARTG
ncbi:MAG: transposase [Planctomycetes bacterium]|nr:transposase [Planctomycetota bacterium]